MIFRSRLQPRARTNRVLPSTSLAAWADTNSVLSAVSIAGETVTLTMANPAASRDLPTSGASWVTPLLDLQGRQITALPPHALKYLLLRWAGATSIAADCWVSLLLINASTVAGATAGYGILAGGNGTGSTQGRQVYTAGWLQGNAGVYDATGRGVVQIYRKATAAAGQSSTDLLDADGAAIGSPYADGTNRALGTFTHVALCCGWLAGTGAGGAQIAVRPSYLASGYSLPGIS
jgi:hypothetical protein